MSTSINKSGVLYADGEGVGENMFLYEPKGYDSDAYIVYQIYITEKLEANKPYTIQFWDVDVSHSGKTAAELGIDAYWGGGSLRMKYWHGTTYFTDGHADYLVGTFTPTQANVDHAHAANLWFRIYNSVKNTDGTKSMHIGHWKLEKGSIATPWTPNPADEIYTGDHGFFEGYDKGSIGKGIVTANEFYEY